MRQASICLVLSLLLAFALVVGAQAGPAEKSDFDFFLGQWAIESRDVLANGDYAQSRAVSHAYRFLDGTAIMDEWRSLDQQGNVVFRGASFRTYLSGDGKWQILWMMAGVKGLTVISAARVGNEIHMNGQGEDPYGTFLERARYFDITDVSYRFTMDRSYDGGKTWISPFNEFTATRVKDGDDQ